MMEQFGTLAGKEIMKKLIILLMLISTSCFAQQYTVMLDKPITQEVVTVGFQVEQRYSEETDIHYFYAKSIIEGWEEDNDDDLIARNSERKESHISRRLYVEVDLQEIADKAGVPLSQVDTITKKQNKQAIKSSAFEQALQLIKEK